MEIFGREREEGFRTFLELPAWRRYFSPEFSSGLTCESCRNASLTGWDANELRVLWSRSTQKLFEEAPYPQRSSLEPASLPAYAVGLQGGLPSEAMPFRASL